MSPAIVVGYDGTEHGDDALALGRLLAGLAGAELVVACAYPDDPLGESAAAHEAARELREDAERRVERAQAWLGGGGAAGGAVGAAAGVSLRALPGASPSQVLHDLAEELHAQAIVVGATHHGRALRLLAGSTPEEVLNHAPCPVAVAPDGFRDAHLSAGGVRQVAVAFDGSPESRHALEIAAAYARAAGARLRLVTAVNSAAAGVYPPPPLDVAAYEELGEIARGQARERLDEAIAALGSEGLAVEGAVLDGDIVGSLLEDAKGDDLLFTGSRAQGPFRRVLVGSVSTHLLRDAPCPVVIVPRGAPA
ncbi:MAG TPA: universal stress protein [Conexibacter sp.]|nr:universal stress protein [Conexibacter sp.]